MTEVAAIGIDAGSTTCKLVAVDAQGEIVGWSLEPTQPRVELQVSEMMDGLRSKRLATGEVASSATGYGRKLIKDAARNVTEITCHAKGVFQDLRGVGK